MTEPFDFSKREINESVGFTSVCFCPLIFNHVSLLVQEECFMLQLNCNFSTFCCRTLTSELGLQWIIRPWRCVSASGWSSDTTCLPIIAIALSSHKFSSTKPPAKRVSPAKLLSNWSLVSCPLTRNADDRGMVLFLWTSADPWGIPNNFYLNSPNYFTLNEYTFEMWDRSIWPL